jgi:hypothetical protein
MLNFFKHHEAICKGAANASISPLQAASLLINGYVFNKNNIPYILY